MDRSILKMDAKAAMKEAAISPYGVTIIFGIIILILTIIQRAFDDWGIIIIQTNAYEDPEQLISYMVSSLIFTAIYFVITSVLEFGYLLFCLKVSNRDTSMAYSDLFHGIRYIFKVLGLNIMIIIFSLLWTLLFIIPGIIASFRYSQAMFILAENPDKGILQCIRESKEMMRNHKFEYFVLELSFLLWILLMIVTFGLASIYVNPYMTITKANYYNAIKPKLAETEEYMAFE
jgi:uncharacterized membrane protein